MVQRLWCLWRLGTLSGLLSSMLWGAGPDNDLFDNRQFLAGTHPRIVSYHTLASLEPGEPVHPCDGFGNCGGSLWWTWTAPDDGMLQIRTTDLNGSPRWIEVYTGDRIEQLSPVAPVSEVGWMGIHAVFPVRRGLAYSIAIGHRWASQEGVVGSDSPVTYQLRWLPRASNDDLSNRQVLEGDVVRLNWTEAYSTPDMDPAAPPFWGTRSGTRWWEWKAKRDAVLEVPDPTGIAVFRGTVPADLEFLPPRGNGYPVMAGQSLFIAVVADNELEPLAGDRRLIFHSLRLTARPIGEEGRASSGVRVEVSGVPSWVERLELNGVEQPDLLGRGFVVLTPLPAGSYPFQLMGIGPNGLQIRSSEVRVGVGTGSDMFATAPEFDPASQGVSADFTDATEEEWESALSGSGEPRRQTIWWRWSPAEDGILIRPDGAQGGVSMALFTGSGPGALNEVPGPNRFGIQAGRTYWIQLWTGSWSPFGGVSLRFIGHEIGDHFAEALPLALDGTSRTLSNTLLTTEDFEGANAQPSRWFRFVAPDDGVVLLDSQGDTAPDSMTLFEGDSVPGNVPGSRVAGRNAAYRVSRGVSYRLRTEHFSWYQHAIPGSLAARFHPVSPHGSPEAAAELLGEQPALRQEAVLATEDRPSDPNLSRHLLGTWIRFQAPAQGVLILGFEDPNRLVIAVDGFRRAASGGFVPGDFPCVFGPAGMFALEAGAEVYVRVAFRSSATRLEETVRVRHRFVRRPANDRFVDRQELVGRDLPVRGIHWTALHDPGELDVAGGRPHRVVWWCWTAPEDGVLEIHSPSVPVRVFTGENLESLQLVAAEDMDPFDGLRCAVVAGRSYQIAVLTEGASTECFPFPGTDLEEFQFSLRLHGWKVGLSGGTSQVWEGDAVPLELDGGPVEAGGFLGSAGFWLSGPAAGQWRPVGGESQPGRPLLLTNLPSATYEVFAAITNLDGRIELTAPHRFRVAPVNDSFSNPIVLPGRNPTVVVPTSGASFEAGEPEWSTDFTGWTGSVWYRWTSRRTGIVRFSGPPNPAVQFFSGTTLETLRPALRTTAGDGFFVEQDREYRIRVLHSYGLPGVSYSSEMQVSSLTFGLLTPIPTAPLLPGRPLTISTTNLEPVASLLDSVILAGTNRIAALGAPPWTFTWTNPVPGLYPLTVEVRTRDGEAVRIPSVLQVQPANQAFTNRSLLAATNGSQSVVAGLARNPVWYRWTAPGNGGLRVVVSGWNPSDPVTLTTGTNSANLTIVSQIRSNPSGTYEWAVEAGRTYNLSLTRSSAPGTEFEMTWRFLDGPANDAFAQRLRLEGESGELGIQLLGSTLETGEPSRILPPSTFGSVWWEWTPTERGILELGSALTPYRGATLTGLQAIPVLGTDGGVRTFRLDPGQPVYLAAHRVVGGALTQRASWRWQASPTNDLFSSPTMVTGTVARIEGSLRGTSFELSAPLSQGGDVWFAWRAERTGWIRLESEGTRGPEVEVWHGSTLETLVPVVSASTDSGPVLAGQEYRIRVFTTDSSVDPFRFRLEWVESAQNDAFSSPRILSGTVIQVSDSNLEAVREFGEPRHDGEYGGRSVWYKWRARSSGRATVRLRRVAWGTGVVAVYRGDRLDGLVPVVAGAMSNGGGEVFVSFDALAGQEYRLAVDSPGGSWVRYDLELTLNPLTAPRLEVQRLPDGSLAAVIAARKSGRWRLEESSDLNAWAPVLEVEAGGEVVRTLETGRQLLFLRLVPVE